MKLYAAVVAALLILGANGDTPDIQRKKAEHNSARIVTDLYVMLRNIVFPKSPLTGDIAYNRLVFLSPGRVLNHLDYSPGNDYEESLLRRNNSAPQALIPPAVMEKWFDVSDVMVGADPFTGGVTAKSMARAYETIISQIKVLGLETKTAEAQAKYTMAKDYLATPVIRDPDNTTLNTTRLSLYTRYQNEYADKKLDMEEMISEARRTQSAVEYELWFQRNYPSLKSKVEGAYMKWITFGEKDLVELYKAYLDTGSSGAEVEDARMVLRASGVTSLDRTRTVYPVSFEPGNWYEYLLPKKIKGPSRDMLIARRSMLQSEMDALQSMIKFNQPEEQANKTLKRFNNTVEEFRKASEEKTNASVTSMVKCLNNSVKQHPESDNTTLNQDGACENFTLANAEAVSATFQQARVEQEYRNAAFLLNPDQFNHFLNLKAESLNRTIQSIENDLNDSEPYLGGVADSREFQNLNDALNVTEQNLDDAWTAFEYDSDSSHINTDEEAKSFSVAASLGVHAPGFTVQASANYAKRSADMMQALSSAKLKVSGEVLRVVIKRPWFRPNIFSNPSLFFVQRDESQQKNTYVSPGPKTDKGLRDAIGGQTNTLYLLPEYVSSFLLARELKLEFSGVDANTVSSTIQMIAGGSFSASYGMFRMAASGGTTRLKHSVTVDRTANGMIINIPGAQVIGYYTEVLPRFPQTQN